MVAFRCPHCGADIMFDPEKESMRCEYCDSIITIDEYNATLPEKGYYTTNELSCTQCGAVIYSTDNTVATFCSYCGSSVVLRNRIVKEKKPDYIIPFSVSDKTAKEIYRNRIDSLLLAPKWMDDETNVSKFRGIYMPFHLLRYSYEGNYSGEGTSFAIETEHGKKYDVTKTWQIEEVPVSAAYDSIPVDASSSFPDNMSRAITPYTKKKMVPFKEPYLAGYYADSADVPPEIYADKYAAAVKSKMATEKPKVKKVEIDTADLINKCELKGEYNSALFPVWFLSFRNKNRISYAAVNGETGELVADVPLDFKKYLISSGQCKAIKEGLTSHMRLDDYGATRIDSLYLDSFDHNLICKSLEKPLYKEKLRVRSYGAFSEADAVYVEIKKKFKGIVYKRRVRMSAEGARAYYTHQMTYEQAQHVYPVLQNPENDLTVGKIQIAREIDAFFKRHPGIEPAMLISCIREAWCPNDIDDQDCVDRITFDESISYVDLLEANAVQRRPVISDDLAVMEIKCAVRAMTRPQKKAPGSGAGPEPAAPVKPKQEKKRNALCPFCGREIMPEARYCNSCGKDLSEAGELEKAASFFDPEYTRKTCIACGGAIPMGARYCHLCGADQKWEGRYVPPSNPENDGEQPENTPESREGPAFRQRMLESAYLTMFDAPEGESVRELFPAGWYGACDETRILALSEAVSKRLRIEETNAWQKAEGTQS